MQLRQQQHFQEAGQQKPAAGPTKRAGQRHLQGIMVKGSACTVLAWRGRRNSKCCTYGCSNAAASSRSPSKGRLIGG